MKKTEERVRFCEACNAVIGWFAEFCTDCGSRVTEASQIAEAPRSVQPGEVEKELFKSHLRLLHRHKEQTAGLAKALDRMDRKLRELEDKKPGPEVARALLEHSERFLELEHEWDDIQRGYNNKSEAIEEEFLDRITELEADIELSVDHQTAIDEEVLSFHTQLEKAEVKLRETARYLDVVRGRHQSHVLGVPTGDRSILVLGSCCLLLAVLGALAGVLWLEIPPRKLAWALSPSWIGLCVLFVLLRSRWK